MSDSDPGGAGAGDRPSTPDAASADADHEPPVTRATTTLVLEKYDPTDGPAYWHATQRDVALVGRGATAAEAAANYARALDAGAGAERGTPGAGGQLGVSRDPSTGTRD